MTWKVGKKKWQHQIGWKKKMTISKVGKKKWQYQIGWKNKMTISTRLEKKNDNIKSVGKKNDNIKSLKKKWQYQKLEKKSDLFSVSSFFPTFQFTQVRGFFSHFVTFFFKNFRLSRFKFRENFLPQKIFFKLFSRLRSENVILSFFFSNDPPPKLHIVIFLSTIHVLMCWWRCWRSVGGCVDDVSMMSWWCVDDLLMICWGWVEEVLMMCWRGVDDVLQNEVLRKQSRKGRKFFFSRYFNFFSAFSPHH